MGPIYKCWPGSSPYILHVCNLFSAHNVSLYFFFLLHNLHHSLYILLLYYYSPAWLPQYIIYYIPIFLMQHYFNFTLFHLCNFYLYIQYIFFMHICKSAVGGSLRPNNTNTNNKLLHCNCCAYNRNVAYNKKL